jgi:hypothetical protein
MFEAEGLSQTSKIKHHRAASNKDTLLRISTASPLKVGNPGATPLFLRAYRFTIFNGRVHPSQR